MSEAGSNTEHKHSLAPTEEDLKSIECPVCNEILTAPILICQTGHSICTGCKDKLPRCPTCKAQWSPARNFTLENIISIMYLPCRYKEDGCEVVEKGELIHAHMTECRFKRGKCPLHGFTDSESKQPCTHESISLREIKNHLLSVHGIGDVPSNIVKQVVKIGSEPSLQSGRMKSGLRLLRFDQMDFVCGVVSPRNSISFFWIVLLIGPKDEETIYRARITLQPNDREMRTWETPVYSTFDRTILNFVRENIQLPTCTWEELKRITKCDGVPVNFTYTVSIYKFEAEAEEK